MGRLPGLPVLLFIYLLEPAIQVIRNIVIQTRQMRYTAADLPAYRNETILLNIRVYMYMYIGYIYAHVSLNYLVICHFISRAI